MSPTQRTLKRLREQGITAGIVERWLAFAGKFGKRQDLFGIIDIIALDPIDGVIGIQSCGNTFSSHYKTITEEKYQNTLEWLETPGTKLEIWSWRKVVKERGSGVYIWRVRKKRITVEDDL
jgi:hypothetical protein